MLKSFTLVAFLLSLLGTQVFDPNEPRSVHWVTSGTRDGSVRLCRLRYDISTDADSDGDGWYIDYPDAELFLSRRLAEHTSVSISKDEALRYGVVNAIDDALYECPMLLLSEPGSVTFSDEDVKALRNFFHKGGFLWVDDFWGEKAWDWWSLQIHRVMPNLIIDVPPEHIIFHILYDIKAVPQIPNVGLWMGSQQTSERGAESAVPHFRAMEDDETGRLFIVMTHNTDFGDALQEAYSDPTNSYFRLSTPAYGLGMNIIIYANTH